MSSSLIEKSGNEGLLNKHSRVQDENGHTSSRG